MEDLNKLAEKVQKPEETADIIKQYEEILRTKRKGIVSGAYYLGKIFKGFKEKEKFIQMVNKIKIHKRSIIFKINIFKLIEKQPGLMKPSNLCHINCPLIYKKINKACLYVIGIRELHQIRMNMIFMNMY